MNITAKKICFYAIMLSIPLLAIVLPALGYFAFKKLTFSFDYCGAYGTFDDELGWRLKENASSCVSLTNRLKGIVYFHSTIYTNSGGFRDAKADSGPPRRSIMTIGDSWTFGYGVNYEESFPYFLSKALGAPVINAGIPGYGSGSNLLLFARNVEKYLPTVVIYHTLGMHSRSLCTERETETTLLPCFYFDKTSGRIALARPKPGAVADAVSRNIYPGGSLTAGYDSLLRFILLVKIREAVRETYATIGRLFRGNRHLDTGFDEKHLQAVLEFELQRYQELASKNGFAFVLIDPRGDYQRAASAVSGQFTNGFVYIGPREWRENVEKKVALLREDEARVPMDGHYGRGQNRIIGDYLATTLRDRHVRLVP